MSTDPHAPTPAGQGPDDVEPASFAPPVDPGEPADPVPAGSVVQEEGAPGTSAFDSELTRPGPTVSLQGADAWQPAPAAEVGVPAAEAPRSAEAVTPPDPVIATPSAFTPPGTPAAGGLSDQAAAMAERPEVQVGLAFLGGAVLSFVLKRLGR